MTWEQRWHPLRQEWIIVAAHRQDRPWIGQEVSKKVRAEPHYVPDCYLCPGNLRVSGARNPDYQGVFVFDNDHPCVGMNAPEVAGSPFEVRAVGAENLEPLVSLPGEGVFRARRAQGHAKVVCYTRRHDQTLAELGHQELVNLLRAWQGEYQALGALPYIDHVLIFENKGEVVGVSNPHPHGQIYATNFVFKTIETEVRASAEHWHHHKRSLLEDVIRGERLDGRRVLDENDQAISFLPYFARYAYELFVAPKGTHSHLGQLSESELQDFASILRLALIRMDNLWQMPFPYVMVLHQAPTDGRDHSGFHFHIQFHPPLRKPNLLKYLAGPEVGAGNFVSDTAPEAKAEELRQVATRHYKAEAEQVSA